MKAQLQEYKPFLLFLAKFFGTYGLLTAVYELYLQQYTGDLVFQVDGFTALVSEQVQSLLQFFGYSANLIAQTTEAGMRLLVEQKPIARIVEGCNAMSVLILFVAFVGGGFFGQMENHFGFCFAWFTACSSAQYYSNCVVVYGFVALPQIPRFFARHRISFIYLWRRFHAVDFMGI